MYKLSPWEFLNRNFCVRFIKGKPKREIFIVAKISYNHYVKETYIGTVIRHDVTKFDYILGDSEIDHFYDKDIDVLKLKIDIFLSSLEYELEKFGV